MTDVDKENFEATTFVEILWVMIIWLENTGAQHTMSAI